MVNSEGVLCYRMIHKSSCLKQSDIHHWLYSELQISQETVFCYYNLGWRVF